MSLGVGDQAPDFTLPGTGGRDISLAEFRGRPVVLVFYPGDDTPVCTKQLNTYNDDLEQFSEMNAQVIGISAQDVSSHDAFAGKHGFEFPLLADTDKAVAAQYGRIVFGAADDGIRSVSLALPTDFPVDRNAFSRGRELWAAKGYHLKYGEHAQNRFGEELPWGEHPDMDYFMQVCGAAAELPREI